MSGENCDKGRQFVKLVRFLLNVRNGPETAGKLSCVILALIVP